MQDDRVGCPHVGRDTCGAVGLPDALEGPVSLRNGRLDGHVPVRFPGSLAAAAKRLAQQDGMSVSAWVRRIVDRELAARSGRCPACGTAQPPAAADPDERG